MFAPGASQYSSSFADEPEGVTTSMLLPEVR